MKKKKKQKMSWGQPSKIKKKELEERAQAQSISSASSFLRCQRTGLKTTRTIPDQWCRELYRMGGFLENQVF
jgi:alpha-D-ribose 1-methylphosphonate 5-triphosphate synthase subunit PhnG